jgi:TRAP-type mannitol/chloroaromatic compound transport system permease small subunit
MRGLLAAARAIDALNERVGGLAAWLVLACVLVSAGNAVARYGFNLGSNAFLEIQWYLYSIVYLCAAGYTLRHDAHVRIDLVAGRFPPRLRAWIDVFGSLFMLAPVCVVLIAYGWSAFLESYRIGEVSPDAGGLARWPIKLVVPLAFALLLLQGLAEAAKRIAFLRGALEAEEPASPEPIRE